MTKSNRSSLRESRRLNCNFNDEVKIILTGIREKTIVKEGGKVEISSLDLPVGSEVEVIVLVDEKEIDETEYLLSTEANRKNLEVALK